MFLWKANARSLASTTDVRMTKKDRFIYLCYIGTTKVAFLKALSRGRDQAEVVALSARLGHGFERGIVKDLAQATQTINEAVAEVVSAEKRPILSCPLVVSNDYLKNYTFQSSVYFQGNPHAVTLRDVR